MESVNSECKFVPCQTPLWTAYRGNSYPITDWAVFDDETIIPVSNGKILDNGCLAIDENRNVGTAFAERKRVWQQLFGVEENTTCTQH